MGCVCGIPMRRKDSKGGGAWQKKKDENHYRCKITLSSYSELRQWICHYRSFPKQHRDSHTPLYEISWRVQSRKKKWTGGVGGWVMEEVWERGKPHAMSGTPVHGGVDEGRGVGEVGRTQTPT